MSAHATLEFLAEHVSRFASLRHAAAWPGPVSRPLVRRWLRHGALGGDAETVVAALRLASTHDDREFCRRVRLRGWRTAATRRDAEFELLDESGEMLWPVAVRALMLFADARPASLRPPSFGPSSDAGRLLRVATRAGEGDGFVVVVDEPAH